MNREEILEFIRANPSFSLATCEGNQPRVRVMQLFRADDDGLVFCTGEKKQVCKQLRDNPAVEMAFLTPDKSVQVRVCGRVVEVDDLDLKKQIVEIFTFLKPWVEAEGYDAMIVFRVTEAKAQAWTMETNRQARPYIDL